MNHLALRPRQRAPLAGGNPPDEDNAVVSPNPHSYDRSPILSDPLWVSGVERLSDESGIIIVSGALHA